MAYADVDGFRIDTVKHMGRAATRFFSSVIHEFAQSLGKDRFYLIGEITGGRANAFDNVEMTGLNAALGIDDVQDKLEFMTKGYRNPEEYFNLFTNSLDLGKESHVWFNDKIITMIDDHDQVRKGGGQKARFAAHGGDQFLLCVIGTNLTTMGVPCLYYGTEQGFDGNGSSDEFLRECMFGGSFGAFRSAGKHFFDPSNHIYQETKKMADLRKSQIALRRGRQYLRPISGNGIDFGVPEMLGEEIRSIVAWSRVFSSEEVICAFNNDFHQSLTAWVTIDRTLNKTGDTYICAYSTQAAEMGNAKLTVEARNGVAVQLTVPPKGFVVYIKS
jgi:glycosidase